MAQLLLLLHAIVLFVAASRLTVITALTGSTYWSFDYFQYAYRNGWGQQYVSDYSLRIVAIYLAAYLIGLIGYFTAGFDLRTWWVNIGGLLSLIGAACFAIELGHWFADYNFSLIAICPVVSLLVCLIIAFRLQILIRERAYSGGDFVPKADLR